MSKEMDALQAAVTAEDTVIDSAVTLLNGIAGQIADAAGDRAKSLTLAADVKAKSDALAAAVAANTPAAPPGPIATTFPNAAALTSAVTAYQAAGGKDGFTLDGTVVGAAGTSGTVNAYFTHSADGHVDMTGPTN